MQIKRKLIPFICAGIIVTACQSDEMESKSISIEDFAGEVGLVDSIVEPNLSAADTLSLEIESETVLNFINLQEDQYMVQEQDEFMLLDRFNPKTKEKLRFQHRQIEEDSVLMNFDLFSYTFEDTVKTKNALYNWFDCFGDGCEMVKMNENMNVVNTKAMQALVFDNEIVLLVNQTITPLNWTKVSADLKEVWTENPNLSFTVTNSKKLIW